MHAYNREQTIATQFRSRLYDLAAALPLIIWLGLGAVGLARQIVSEIAVNPASARLAFQIASEITTVLFLALQIVFLVVRRLPTAKEPGLLPRAIAAVGANGALLLLALPRVPRLTMGIAIASYLLVTAGMVLSIFVLIWLGRSFSIFPQARALVTSGPYNIIRHPLYLSEFLVSFGAMWQFSQPWATLVTLGIVAAQIPRMYYEEDILRATFPEYSDHAARVRWRLLPLVY